MPRQTNRICGRCRRSIPPGRCPHCDQPWTRKPTSWTGGSTRRWRTLRQAKLDTNLDENNGLCERSGCQRLAVEVHHEGGFTTDAERYDWARLRALCGTCHGEATREQSQQARNGSG